MDKKLTDADIETALMCCNTSDCSNCPYGKYNVMGWSCMPKLRADTLDLINRLQAENERLTNCRKEEIEKLMVATDKVITETKAEAYKEFAERLKDKFFSAVNFIDELREVVAVDDINNLLKELVGDN